MTTELLQTAAERGHARGAATVWAEAHRQVSEADLERSAKPSPIGFRLAVAAVALVLVAVSAARLAQPEAGEPLRVADPAGTTDVVDLTDPDLPDPILIDDTTLQHVDTPVDLRDHCADAPLEEIDPETGGPVSNTCRERSFAVFAEETQPFDGPIVVLELHPNGTTELRGLNLTEASADYGDAVVRTEIDGEDTWTLDPEIGLVEVARFADTSNVQIQAGWNFEFERGSELVVLQNEPDLDEAGEWRWIAREAPSSDDRPMTASTIEVLGAIGVQIGTADPDDRWAVWSSGDRTYRLLAADKDDDYRPLPVQPSVERLRIADRAEWTAAVDAALTTTPAEWLQEFGDLIVFLALVVLSLFLALIKRPLLAGAAFTAGWLFFTVANWDHMGPVLLLLFVPLLFNLVQHTARTKAPPPPPRSGPPPPPPPPSRPVATQ